MLILTFSSHADLETFLESTVLALIAVVLIDGTVATTAARVGEITTNRSLEEALASFARQHAVVLAGALVAAHDTLGAELKTISAGRCRLIAMTRRIGDGSDVRVLLRMMTVLR